MEPSEEELRAIVKGRRYEQMRQTEGWAVFIERMICISNEHLSILQKGRELDAQHTVRLVDMWRASEDFYQEAITEVEGSIREKDRLEMELRQEGLIAPLIGPEPAKGDYS